MEKIFLELELRFVEQELDIETRGISWLRANQFTGKHCATFAGEKGCVCVCKGVVLSLLPGGPLSLPLRFQIFKPSHFILYLGSVGRGVVGGGGGWGGPRTHLTPQFVALIVITRCPLRCR